MKSHVMILAGSNLTDASLHSGSKGNNTTTSPTSFSERVGSASTALHTGSQVFINSLKPKEGCKSKIRGANPRQLVCKQVIRVVSMSVSPADMMAKSTSTLSSWGPYNENTKFWLQTFCPANWPIRLNRRKITVELVCSLLISRLISFPYNTSTVHK